MSFNWGLIADNLPLLLQGALVTVEITAMSVGCGFFIGLLVSLANLSKFRLVRLLAKCYVDIIRGTPLLVQIFLIYFALPIITGQRIDPYIAAVTACSINSGAYVSEIFRAGIQSIDKGQMEAGRSLGLTWGQTMRYIIMPQAFKAIIPPLGNEFIAMLKDSSCKMPIPMCSGARCSPMLRPGISYYLVKTSVSVIGCRAHTTLFRWQHLQ